MKLVARLSTAAVLAGFVSAAPASAQMVDYSGTTLGCFYTTVVCTPASTSTLGGLTFNGNTFTGRTQDGFGAIGSLSATENNLGVFSLPAGAVTPRNFGTAPANFLLWVQWTAPVGATPTQLPFTAALSGVLGTSSGGVTIRFEDARKEFTFDGGAGALRLNDVSLNNTGVATAVPVTGDFTVTATTVPEPSTYVLLASGLAGLLMFGKRRQKNV